MFLFVNRDNESAVVKEFMKAMGDRVDITITKLRDI
jgi:hypothetical protein